MVRLLLQEAATQLHDLLLLLCCHLQAVLQATTGATCEHMQTLVICEAAADAAQHPQDHNTLNQLVKQHAMSRMGL